VLTMWRGVTASAIKSISRACSTDVVSKSQRMASGAKGMKQADQCVVVVGESVDNCGVAFVVARTNWAVAVLLSFILVGCAARLAQRC